MSYFPFLIFTVFFLLICNWRFLKIFTNRLIGHKTNLRVVEDEYIFKTLRKKAGLKKSKLIIANSDKLFARMLTNPPFQAKVLLSKGIYKHFNENELEWIVLHEGAHYKFHHGLKLLLVQTSILVAGYFILSSTSVFWMIPLLIFVAYLIYNQFVRQYELEADKFAIARVEDPSAVITAQKKLIKFYNIGEKSLKRRFLGSGTPPSKRVELAQDILNKQKT